MKWKLRWKGIEYS